MRHTIQQLRNFFVLSLLLCGVGAVQVLAQAGQLSAGRIDDMPNLPQPYEMRDWKAVVRGADSLMFDKDATGQYLPLVRFRRPYNGTRLTDSIFGVPSYVGDTRGEGLEGILTLPSVVSGLLVGVDKRAQDGVDYVRATQDWYSRRDNENVYLNLPLTSTGSDWWYETMPNVFFHHIYDLAGPYGEADAQFVRVGQQWQRVVTALGGSATPWRAGNFNYRSFRIRDLTPVASGVPEPEAAGAIAYLLENTYRKTGEVRYRYATEQALEFLNGLDRNPRYELQLHYGVLAAARLNATEGTRYDLEKLLGWSLSRGPLRQWGVSVTSAGGYDLHGLVGESEGGNDYLFYMNGVQAVAALAPMVRYDARFARTIGKYVLNVANNSRLFFSPYLPAENQDSYDWASAYDPKGYFAYEALRERLNGKSPFATGDAIRSRWAPTNLGLYGTAHTGYLAAVVDTTDVRGVLELNLNATDFLGPPSYPTRLYFNPYDAAVTVTARRPIDVGAGAADLYETTGNNFLARDVTNDYVLTVPAGEARVLVWTPSSGTFQSRGLRGASVDGIIVTYTPQVIAPEGVLRIKAAVFASDSVMVGDTARLHVVTDGPGGQVGYEVVLNGVPFTFVGEERLDLQRSVLLLRAGTALGGYTVPVDATLPSSPNTGGDRVRAFIRIVARTSGIEEAGAVQTVSAAPNPSAGQLSLKLPTGAYQLNVTDALGRSLLLGNFRSVADRLDLDLSALPAGLVFLHVTHLDGGARFAARVVLRH